MAPEAVGERSEQSGIAVKSRLTSWWTRPAGVWEVLVVAIPMIISAGSIAIMQFTDRIFLTWYDPLAMGSAFSGGSLYWLAVAFPFSIVGFVNAFVSQYNGSKQYNRIGTIVWQGLFIGLALAPLYVIAAPLFRPFFYLFGHSESMIRMEMVYLYWCLWGAGAQIGNESLSAFFSGRKKVGVVMNVNIVCVVVNIVLDYCLIFGVAGYCRWGLMGAALATSISQWIRLLIFLTLMVRQERISRRFGLWSDLRLELASLGKLLSYGGMGGVQFFVDMISFSFFILIIGRVGEVANAATAIAFNLNSLTFLPVVGAGIAVTTLVGNYLGANRPDLASRATITALTITILVSLFFGFFYLFMPNLLLYPFMKWNPAQFEPLRETTIVLLRFVSLYLLFDTIGIMFSSAIKGAGDTRFVMVVTLCACPFLILPIWLGIYCFHGGLYWCWSVISVWYFLLCLVYARRFFQGKWKSMRLTE
ncbi:MAG: MATE family efflux transporter [Planctomycetia bacterium]|nr:MATE family efflux transporter [Planctomycetia bacterium]